MNRLENGNLNLYLNLFIKIWLLIRRVGIMEFEGILNVLMMFEWIMKIINKVSLKERMFLMIYFFCVCGDFLVLILLLSFVIIGIDIILLR